MSSDPIQPGGEFCGRLVSLPRAVNAQEHLLSQLLSYGLVLHHAIQEMVDGGAVLPEQEAETSAIPILDPKHQLGIAIKSHCGSHNLFNPLLHKRFRGREVITLPSACGPLTAGWHPWAGVQGGAWRAFARR